MCARLIEHDPNQRPRHLAWLEIRPFIDGVLADLPLNRYFAGSCAALVPTNDVVAWQSLYQGSSKQYNLRRESLLKSHYLVVDSSLTLVTNTLSNYELLLAELQSLIPMCPRLNEHDPNQRSRHFARLEIRPLLGALFLD